MSLYTKDDVYKKAAAWGLLDSMSDADRRLTEANPDAGMSVLQCRSDYGSASTAEDKARAHQKAESVRRLYGGYSGGSNGTKYYIESPSPASYQQQEAPAYTDAYTAQKEDALKSVLSRGTYTSANEQNSADLIRQITENSANTGDNTQALWDAYQKQYRREGQRAAADALGRASALTGGIPSSAAVTAGSQAAQEYAAALSDKLPSVLKEGESLASQKQNRLLEALNALNAEDNTEYQRWLDQAGQDADKLALLRALSSDDYSKYRDSLSQYNTDRAFGYNQLADDLSYKSAEAANDQSQENYQNETAYAQRQNQTGQLWQAALYAMEYFNDSTLLKKLISAAEEGSL